MCNPRGGDLFASHLAETKWSIFGLWVILVFSQRTELKITTMTTGNEMFQYDRNDDLYLYRRI